MPLHQLKALDTKPLIASVVSGFYLAALVWFNELILAAVYAVTGIALSISSPVLALMVLFALTAPLGIVMSNLVSRDKLSYEKALVAGMITTYTFCLVLFLPILVVGRGSISLFAGIGITFFMILFGFILAALAAVLHDKIYPERKTII